MNGKRVFGFVKPAIDAHSLGMFSLAEIIKDCGYTVVLADTEINSALENLSSKKNLSVFLRWLKNNRITDIGFSYRLDPNDGFSLFSNMMFFLIKNRMLRTGGKSIQNIYYAGLAEGCRKVEQEFGRYAKVFIGGESISETLNILSVDSSSIPPQMRESCRYDNFLFDFSRDIIKKGEYTSFKPVERNGYGGYEGYGTKKDTLLKRLEHSQKNNLPPIIRAHAGPYLQESEKAVKLFYEWCEELGKAGMLDVLSIGSSQLTQSHFGQDWQDLPNGGGVPVNSIQEYSKIWESSRPMLVRTYAGTKDLLKLAMMYEDTINIAWHALSLWWFSQIDGRGGNGVYENLKEHIRTIQYAALTNKPFEPNVPHHFAFRGADDVTYIVSAYLAAMTAKKNGIKHLILQNMLNTPKYTWNIADLAKSRAMLELVRSLEDEDFKVTLQTRAGLDYFSPDPEKAKIQLGAVTALMDDIQPQDQHSPEIIHVVSYSEGYGLADPQVINESIKITLHTLEEYRKLKKTVSVMKEFGLSEIDQRKDSLLQSAKKIISTMQEKIPNLYSASGLYTAFACGFLPVPYLYLQKEEFEYARAVKTKIMNGSVVKTDEYGNNMTDEQFLDYAKSNISKIQIQSLMRWGDNF